MPNTFPVPKKFNETPPPEIHMVSVNSSQVAAIGYDQATKMLAVRFSRGPGHLYCYPNCDEKTHAEFMAAESKGTFFGKRIKAMAFDKFQAPSDKDDGGGAA